MYSWTIWTLQSPVWFMIDRSDAPANRRTGRMARALARRRRKALV
jgi:hypothetical protein